MWPKASPIGQKDPGALHSHEKPLPSGQKGSLSVRSLSVTGDMGTQASSEELGDILRITLTQLCLLLISRIREIL